MNDREIKTTESQLTALILEYLRRKGIKCWRDRQMAHPTRHVRPEQAGISDILGVLMPHGRFLAIEVKLPGRKTADKQARFLEEVRRCGGLAFVATSLEDVMRGLVDGCASSNI